MINEKVNFMNQANQHQSAEKLLSQGWNCLRNQRINDAIKISQQLNKYHPNNAQAWYFTAQVALKIGNTPAAKKCLNNACKIHPNHASLKIALANVYLRENDFEQIKLIISDIENLSLTATDHNQVAMLCSQLKLSNRAIAHYQNAISLEAQNHEHHYSLAAVLRHAGELQQAEEHLTKAIELQPLDIDAHTLRVDLKKQTGEHNYVDSLNALLTKQLSARKQVQVQFALAKSYEDMGDCSQAFEHLQLGSNLRRKHLEYNVENDIATMTQISQSFDQNWWQKPSKQVQEPDNTDIVPIFILGMPRTGSTLTDQILTAGDNVHSAGELNDFSRLLTERVKATYTGEIKNKLQFIAAAADIDFAKLGQDYLRSVKTQLADVGLGQKVHYFTDKLPLNFLYVGLLKKALPNAKIIHVTRDPMDTCYAIFKTLFQQAYPFSYDQKELGQYFIAYQKLMKHWQQCDSLNIHTVSYEDLVTDTEKTAEKLYQFCGLQWQSEFADVQNNTASVNTASASQVRQAIYKSSVQKWRNYEQQLAPLKQILEQAGIRCD